MGAQLALQFGETLTARFARFHAANPHVMGELERRALALYHRGFRRIGIALLFESARYDRMLQTTGDEYKLNNSFRALYARMLIDRHPELAGVIETRQRKAA